MNQKRRDFFTVYVSLVLAVFVVTIFSNTIHVISLEQVASVSSVGAKVAETPMNKLAYDLKHYSESLDTREKILSEREALLTLEQERVKSINRNIMIGSTSISLILLFIMYVYMYRRNRSNIENEIKNPKYSHFKHYLRRQNYKIDLHQLS